MTDLECLFSAPEDVQVLSFRKVAVVVLGAIVLPLTAVHPGPEGASVTVRRSLGNEQIFPQLGRRNDEWVEVLSGLEEGDQVLLPGGES